MPGVRQSFSLPLHKTDTSLNQTLELLLTVLQSFSLTLHKTDTFLKWTPWVGPCGPSIITFNFLQGTQLYKTELSAGLNDILLREDRLYCDASVPVIILMKETTTIKFSFSIVWCKFYSLVNVPSSQIPYIFPKDACSVLYHAASRGSLVSLSTLGRCSWSISPIRELEQWEQPGEKDLLKREFTLFQNWSPYYMSLNSSNVGDFPWGLLLRDST